MVLCPKTTYNYSEHSIISDNTTVDSVYILECMYCSKKIYRQSFLNDDICHFNLRQHNKDCLVKNR